MQQQPLFDLEQYIQVIPEEDQQSMFVMYFGEEEAAKITEKLGGLSFFVPSENHGAHYDRLVEKVGVELAKKIVETFAGEELYIPKEQATRTIEKHRQVRVFFQTLIHQGWVKKAAIQEVAKIFDLSERQIARILK